MADDTHDRFDRDARTGETPSRVARLSDLGDFEVAEGYPDVRGWDVLAADGTRVGEVKDLIVDTGAMRTRYLDVELDDELRADRAGGEKRVLVPIGFAQLEDDGDRVRLFSLSIEQVVVLPTYDERSLQTDVARFAHADFDDRRFYGQRGRMNTRPETADETRGTRATEDVSQSVTGQYGEGTIRRRPITSAEEAERVIRPHRVADQKTAEADVRREPNDVGQTGRAGRRGDVRGDPRAP